MEIEVTSYGRFQTLGMDATSKCIMYKVIYEEMKMWEGPKLEDKTWYREKNPRYTTILFMDSNPPCINLELRLSSNT